MTYGSSVVRKQKRTNVRVESGHGRMGSVVAPLVCLLACTVSLDDKEAVETVVVSTGPPPSIGRDPEMLDFLLLLP